MTTPEAYLIRRPTARSSAGKPTAVDLFSGAGGLTLGLVDAGFDVRFSADRDEACEATHRRNLPSIPFARANIEHLAGTAILRETGLKAGELDLLVGGPPCQGFSIIGQRKIWDARNGLVGRFVRIAEELQPRCVLIENVPGLATLEQGAVLREIGRQFAQAGYSVECAELLAAQYGVPQMRWRMFFIAWRNDQGRTGGFPTPTHGRTGIGDLVPNRTITPAEMEGFLTIGEAIGDLPAIEAGESASTYDQAPKTPYQLAMRAGAPKLLANHYAARLAPQNLARIRALGAGQDWRDLPDALLPESMRRALRKDHTRRYRRMCWDGVARSIITRFRDPKSGEYTHPEQHRTISIREAARIQSFPDWFVFEGSYTQQYDQVGNAVPVLLGRAVATEIRKLLEGGRTRKAVAVKSRYRMPATAMMAAE